MKKQIASLAVILLAVSSLAFYGCGGQNEGNIEAQDPEDTGESVGGDEGLEGEAAPPPPEEDGGTSDLK